MLSLQDSDLCHVRFAKVSMKKIHLAVYRSIVICAKKDFHQEKYDFTCVKNYSLVNQMINKRISVVLEAGRLNRKSHKIHCNLLCADNQRNRYV